jgi:hypothetical protein
MIKKIALILLLIVSLFTSIYGANYYVAWSPHEAVIVQYVKDELIWVRTEEGFVTRREPVVGVFYVYSCPNPDRGVNWLGFPNDRVGGYSYLKAYYNVIDDDRVKEATNLANQWLQTEEGKEAVEKAKKQFHKR